MCNPIDNAHSYCTHVRDNDQQSSDPVCALPLPTSSHYIDTVMGASVTIANGNESIEHTCALPPPTADYHQCAIPPPISCALPPPTTQCMDGVLDTSIAIANHDHQILSSAIRPLPIPVELTDACMASIKSTVQDLKKPFRTLLGVDDHGDKIEEGYRFIGLNYLDIGPFLNKNLARQGVQLSIRTTIQLSIRTTK
jgi:hypothetical protein